MAGHERTVVMGLMSYVREDGTYRTAVAGETVRVHPDHVERFDRLNRLQGQEPAEQEKADPKPRTSTRTRKES